MSGIAEAIRNGIIVKIAKKTKSEETTKQIVPKIPKEIV